MMAGVIPPAGPAAIGPAIAGRSVGRVSRPSNAATRPSSSGGTARPDDRGVIDAAVGVGVVARSRPRGRLRPRAAGATTETVVRCGDVADDREAVLVGPGRDGRESVVVEPEAFAELGGRQEVAVVGRLRVADRQGVGLHRRRGPGTRARARIREVAVLGRRPDLGERSRGRHGGRPPPGSGSESGRVGRSCSSMVVTPMMRAMAPIAAIARQGRWLRVGRAPVTGPVPSGRS